MKVKSKIILLILLVLLTLLIVKTVSLANEKTEDNKNFEYTIENNKVRITKYIGKENEIVIPSEIEGYPVTMIGKGEQYERFIDGWTLDKINITIPDTVTSIENYAFHGCNATNIELPNSLKYIGDYAFYECYSLENITIPESVTYIGKKAYGGYTHISIDENNNKYSVENNALYSKDKTTLFYSIGDIEIPNTVKIISDYAFDNCYDVKIPNSVISIGNYAFKDCYNLENIIIPSSVTNIGYLAFNVGTNVNVDTNNKNYSSENGALYNKDKTTIIHYPYNENKNIVIPDTVTTIGDYAFSGFKELESINLSNNLTKIGNYAFNYCYNLKIPSIPENVTSIGDYAFRDCDSIIDLKIPNTVKSIGHCAFSGCDALESIIIPESVEHMGESIFDACTKLKTVTILSKIQSIPNRIFSNCYMLESITIPDTVKNIGNYAFSSCFKLSEIEIPNGVTNIGEGAFNGCDALESIIMPENLTSIGAYAFSACYSLKDITLPSNLTKIGNNAFGYCKSLTNITIPDGVTSIEYGTFINCKNLKSITISSGVSKIDETAFWRIDNLTIYCCSDTLANDFAELYKIRHAVFDKEVIIAYNNDFKYQINDDEITILECYSKNESIEIPESIEGYPVTRIGENAFLRCENLKRITIKKNITDIANNIFKNTDNITILGYSNSYAEEYAKNNNIKFKSLDSKEPDKSSYIVTFKDYDGTVLKQEEVKKGKNATPPVNPKREGYEFVSWNKPFSNVTADLEIIAEYEEIITQLEKEYKIGNITAIPAILNTSSDILTKEEIQKIYNVSDWNVKNEGRLSTGDEFKVGEKVYTVVIYGDVNKDGYVDSADALLVEQYAVKMPIAHLDEIQQSASDVDKIDGKINSTDSLKMKKFKIGLENVIVKTGE